MRAFLRARTREANLMAPSDAVASRSTQGYRMPLKDGRTPRRPVAPDLVLTLGGFGCVVSDGHQEGNARGAFLCKSPSTCRSTVDDPSETAHPCGSSYAREVSTMRVPVADCLVSARGDASPDIGTPPGKQRTNNTKSVGPSVGHNFGTCAPRRRLPATPNRIERGRE
jgi:hypothetical protein